MRWSHQAARKWSSTHGPDEFAPFTIEIPGYLEGELKPTSTKRLAYYELRGAGKIQFLPGGKKDKKAQEIFAGIFEGRRQDKGVTLQKIDQKEILVWKGSLFDISLDGLLKKQGQSALSHDKTAGTYFMVEILLEDNDSLKSREADIVLDIAKSAVVGDWPEKP